MINPLRKKYIKVKKLNAWRYRVIIASSAIVLAAFFFSKIEMEWANTLTQCVDVLGSVSIITAAILSLFCSCYHIEAEDDRRKMVIDNAFDTKFGEEKSFEYYTNDELKKGIDRLSANYFESCFYTNHIAKSMVKGLRWKAVLLLIPFLCAIFFRDTNLFILLTNIAIVSLVVSNWVRVEILASKTKSIFEQYRTIYDNILKKLDKSAKEGKMTQLILDYEAAISWSHILLDENIYKKHQKELSCEWEVLKQSYKLS
ncbi:MAG: hypothetical protein ACOXZI_02190 [Candidatus Cryptobacteroides sp.]